MADPTPFQWNEITSTEEVDDILLASNESPQIIYKHSKTCGICFMAKKSLDGLSSSEAEKADFYIVDVIHDRPISKYIAEKLNIRHESPQLFIIKDGEAKWHASHFNVRKGKLLENMM